MTDRTSKVIDIPIVGRTKIYRNLSFENYFASYSRGVDGVASLATYSFNSQAFGTLHKLMPFSTFYVAPKHQKAAERFVRRFPLYVVYIVPELHTKCIFFQKSRRLLIGSQNLYSPTSHFEELTCEIEVPANMAAEVFKLAFDFPAAEYLRIKYGVDDIRIYGESVSGVTGKPYLPCHKEHDYWRVLGTDDNVDHGETNHYIYLILEYQLNTGVAYLAFDRHYQFCGELTDDAVDHLNNVFNLRKQDYAFLGDGKSLDPEAPFKDQFAAYHPIARDNKPLCAHYIDRQWQ